MQITLIPDIPCIDFIRRVEHRLKLIGVEVIYAPKYITKRDILLIEYARKFNAYIVTTDRGLKYEYDKIILLPHGSSFPRPKRWFYEEWWTILCKQLNKIRRLSEKKEEKTF